MELERDTLTRLIQYLKDHGYPEDSFAVEYQVGRYRADLVIIDPKTKIPLIIFEIKSQKNKNTIDFGKNQLTKLSSNIKGDIPLYLVFPKNEEPYFEIEKIVIKDDNIAIEKDVPITSLQYKYQRNSRISEKTNEKENDKVEAIDKLSIVCWILGSFVLILAIVNKFTQFNLEATDISLLGVSIGLFIIPFASKIKILGMEFERLKKDKNE